jgi:hypothetical protein
MDALSIQPAPYSRPASGLAGGAIRPRHRRGSRGVTLKRNPAFRPVAEADLKWIGAAWRKGGLKALGEDFARTDLAPDEMLGRARELLSRLPSAWMLEAPVQGRPRPVGLLAGTVDDRRLTPHVLWFPWASKRNRLEAVVKFLNVARRDFVVLVWARRDEAKFFECVARHGILKRMGPPIPGFFADGMAGELWFTRLPKPRPVETENVQ